MGAGKSRPMACRSAVPVGTSRTLSLAYPEIPNSKAGVILPPRTLCLPKNLMVSQKQKRRLHHSMV